MSVPKEWLVGNKAIQLGWFVDWNVQWEAYLQSYKCEGELYAWWINGWAYFKRMNKIFKNRTQLSKIRHFAFVLDLALLYPPLISLFLFWLKGRGSRFSACSLIKIPFFCRDIYTASSMHAIWSCHNVVKELICTLSWQSLNQLMCK